MEQSCSSWKWGIGDANLTQINSRATTVQSPNFYAIKNGETITSAQPTQSSLPDAALKAKGGNKITIFDKYVLEFYKGSTKVRPLFQCGDNTEYELRCRSVSSNSIIPTSDWTPEYDRDVEEVQAYQIKKSGSKWIFRPASTSQGAGKWGIWVNYMSDGKQRYSYSEIVSRETALDEQSSKGLKVYCTVVPLDTQYSTYQGCGNGDDIAVSGGYNGISYSISTTAIYDGRDVPQSSMSANCNISSVNLVRGDDLTLSVSYGGATKTWHVLANL